jgi:transcription elongation factor Elf1
MIFRRRPRDRSPGSELIVCLRCGSDFVSPLQWREQDETNWWMRLRCGQCGEVREAVVSQEVADRYDRALDRTSDTIGATLARLDRQRMTAEVEAFATALRLDLFDAADFAVASRSRRVRRC